MRRIEKWMLVELTYPTIIGELHDDEELRDGYSTQVQLNDILFLKDVLGKPKTILVSPSGRYILGEPDKTWWRSR